MAIRDLIPWSRNRDVPISRGDEISPFMTLHREMNRLFDDFFRGFDLAPVRSSIFNGSTAWPSVEVSETDKEVRVTAELPGLDEKDIDVQLSNGVLAIKGEKRGETEDSDRRFSERWYGRFERRIAIDDVDEDKVSASFKNGVLTVILPKSPALAGKVKHIPIAGK